MHIIWHSIQVDGAFQICMQPNKQLLVSFFFFFSLQIQINSFYGNSYSFWWAMFVDLLSFLYCIRCLSTSNAVLWLVCSNNKQRTRYNQWMRPKKHRTWSRRIFQIKKRTEMTTKIIRREREVNELESIFVIVSILWYDKHFIVHKWVLFLDFLHS